MPAFCFHMWALLSREITKLTAFVSFTFQSALPFPPTSLFFFFHLLNDFRSSTYALVLGIFPRKNSETLPLSSGIQVVSSSWMPHESLPGWRYLTGTKRIRLLRHMSPFSSVENRGDTLSWCSVNTVNAPGFNFDLTHFLSPFGGTGWSPLLAKAWIAFLYLSSFQKLPVPK